MDDHANIVLEIETEFLISQDGFQAMLIAENAVYMLYVYFIIVGGVISSARADRCVDVPCRTARGKRITRCIFNDPV